MGSMIFSDYVKQRTLVGLWLGQTPDEPCPFNPEEVERNAEGKPIRVWLMYDQMEVITPEGTGLVRVQFWFRKQPMAHVDVPGAWIEPLGTTLTVQNMKGRIPVEFDLH